MPNLITTVVAADLVERLAVEPRATVRHLGQLTIITLRGGTKRLEIRPLSGSIRVSVASTPQTLSLSDPEVWADLDRLIEAHGYRITTANSKG